MPQLSEASSPESHERVGLCVIRFRTWEGRLVMTVTTWVDVESRSPLASFSTVDLGDVLDAVRRHAHDVSRGRNSDS